MSDKKNNTILKVLLGVLGLGLILLTFYTVNFYREKQADFKDLKTQKSTVTEKLEKIQSHYADLVEVKEGMKKRLKAKKKRVQRLLDSVESLEKDYKRLKKYQIEAEMLQRQNDRLALVADSLSKKNQKLKKEIDSAETDLDQKEKTADSLQDANRDLHQQLDESKEFSLSEVRASFSDKAKLRHGQRVQNLEICFESDGEISSEKEKVYIQVLNPNHNLVSGGQQKTFDRKVLNYCTSLKIKKSGEHCVDIAAIESKLKPGTYTVNIFVNAELIAQKEVTRK